MFRRWSTERVLGTSKAGHKPSHNPTAHTGDLSAERRSVDGFALVLDVDVELAGRQSPVDDGHLVVLLFLLEHFRLTRARYLHIQVL